MRLSRRRNRNVWDECVQVEYPFHCSKVRRLTPRSWCGNSSYTTSGNDKVYMQFQDTNIPAISSEVGCNLQSGPRTFGEVAAILGTMFPATFSGVVVYEWPEDENGYGLVEYLESDGTGFPSTLADYNNLGEVYTTASPVSTALTDYTPSNTPPSCPSSNSIWPLGDTDSLPTIQALNMDTVTARTTYYSASDSLPIAAASATGTQTGVTNSASQTSSPEAQQGLSTGAIAGIAVGGAVLGIASALLAFLFLRRRRRHQNEVVESHTTDSTSDDRDTERFKKAELPGASANSFTAKQELSADHVQEADGAPRVNELDSNGRRIVHEMSGSGAKVAELEGKGSVREPE